jgi:leukotriene-A4 hydrolase
MTDPVSLVFDVSSPWPAIGSLLKVSLAGSHSINSTFDIIIAYKTNENGTSMSWMTKEQTACKTMEYMYTQCEDIACRSLAPMQDTPANKITYTANVTVTKGFDVRMSANRTAEYHNDTHSAYKFSNQIPMASYLMAIAVGDLAYKALDVRTGVITEPCRLDDVAWELQELPMFLNMAEEYLTTYIWGSYAVLILPPSFPMGGMENPLLTFASPTIITGDRSQVDVAIHEIVHSWTGNEVTTENWSNMWLNEGFTVFEERKVSARIHDVDFSKVAAFIGNISSVEDKAGYGTNNSFASLYPVLDDHSFPDDSFSNIPYENGFQFLWYIESLIGETYMQELLRTNILSNSLKSVNYHNFKANFEMICDKYFPVPLTIKSLVDWDAWVHGTGPPPVWQDFTTPALNKSHELADTYVKSGGKSSPDNYLDYKDYSSNLKVIFLDRLRGQS